MPKYAELTELDRGKVLGLHLSGNSMSEISKKLKISKGSVCNTIKRYWGELERRLKKRAVHPKNKSELEVAVKEEWLKIPYETLEKLIESMPRRIEACISNDGWPTRY
jgi:transposase